MLDTVKINHVQHISFTQSRLTDAVSVILSELLSYEHPSKLPGADFSFRRPYRCASAVCQRLHDVAGTGEGGEVGRGSLAGPGYPCDDYAA